MMNKEAGIVRGLKRLAVSARRITQNKKAFDKYDKAMEAGARGGSTRNLKELEASMQTASEKLRRNTKLMNGVDKKSVPSKIKKGLSSVHNYIKKSFKNNEGNYSSAKNQFAMARA